MAHPAELHKTNIVVQTLLLFLCECGSIYLLSIIDIQVLTISNIITVN